MRAALTIIYNSIEDLNHNGFSQFMVANFDHWIIVDGSSKNGGSTGWCNKIETTPSSTDGTLDFISGLALWNQNVHIYSQDTHYNSKDEQFNIGVDILRSLTTSCYLWQVDSDEQWTIQDLEQAEQMLSASSANVAEFQFNHYVINGDTTCLAKGDWGSGSVNRLWKWDGQRFDRHEPAVMTGQTTPVLLPQKFEHYSYCVEKKIAFKSKYYQHHENVYRNWKLLPTFKFPCHISKLFGKNNPVGRGNSFLHKIELPCANVPNQRVKEAVSTNAN